ncbi:hypothetical protein NDU88_010269 [Pleurodeles waltl]|uniref:Uncharacterized protein n=1 Tax=Pleurodeles waltl TaxID=8319 RepID=A0AAV7PVF5_PLEWA|nr:hypothetical protein NDU88_010269 [Pleurodeles waltl]
MSNIRPLKIPHSYYVLKRQYVSDAGLHVRAAASALSDAVRGAELTVRTEARFLALVVCQTGLAQFGRKTGSSRKACRDRSLLGWKFEEAWGRDRELSLGSSAHCASLSRGVPGPRLSVAQASSHACTPRRC